MTGARKTLLVTGGSTGIGAAVARLAAKQGYDVAIGWRGDAAGAEAVHADCVAAGVNAVTLRADLSQPNGPAALFAGFDAAFPRLDAFVNNAGVVDVAARVEDYDEARLRRMFDTNLTGPFLCAGAAVRRMSTRHGHAGGVIVNISSAAARLGGAGNYVDYAASKAGIDLLTKGLADEVAAEGIRVCGLRPGIIETDIHAKGGQPDRARLMAPNVPMRRSGTAGEVAEAVMWLISEGASYVTGATLDVSGGR